SICVTSDSSRAKAVSKSGGVRAESEPSCGLCVTFGLLESFMSLSIAGNTARLFRVHRHELYEKPGLIAHLITIKAQVLKKWGKIRRSTFHRPVRFFLRTRQLKALVFTSRGGNHDRHRSERAYRTGANPAFRRFLFRRRHFRS